MENYSDEPTGIDLDNLGNIYVTGKSGIGPLYEYQFATVKYTSNGAQEWVKTYIGPANLSAWANAVVVDNQNNIYVTGRDYASDTTSDYVTIKYSPNGTEEWIARYSAGVPQGDDWATAVCVDQDNYVYVTGCSYGSGTGWDYATIKYIQFLRGDANGDGVIDIGDVVYLISYLYRGGPAPDPVEVGDCNCDGVVDLGDVVYLISYLFRGGPPPSC